MKLEDLKPMPQKFFMKKLNQSITLRAWTVEDQIWLQQEYGKDKIQSIFNPESVDISAICRIAYRLIDDKSPFKAEQRKTFDENGEPIVEKVGGWRKMAILLSDVSEQVELFTAVVKCIGVSMPEVDEVKKKVSEEEIASQPIGAKSSTYSQANMDGQSAPS